MRRLHVQAAGDAAWQSVLDPQEPRQTCAGEQVPGNAENLRVPDTPKRQPRLPVLRDLASISARFALAPEVEPVRWFDVVENRSTCACRVCELLWGRVTSVPIRNPRKETPHRVRCGVS